MIGKGGGCRIEMYMMGFVVWIAGGDFFMGTVTAGRGKR